MKNAETKTSVGWSILPSDVLDIILYNLFHVSDYVRFGAVCKSWKSVAINYQKQKRIAAVHDQPPMLLFIDAADYSRHTGLFNLGSRSKLLSIGEERLYENGFRFDQWISNHKVICLGSSYGWLAMEQSTSRIMLINPFTRKVIEIPRVPFRRVFKIVMSCDPSKHPDDLVIAALARNGRIALITLGQQRWTIVDQIYCRTENNRGDIIFHNRFLYVVDTYSDIYVIDYKHSQTYDRKVPKVGFFMEEEKDHWEGIEMVRTSDAIFLSDNSCLCIDSAESRTSPNSIYFSFNFRDKRYPEHFRFWEHQTGVYNLEDGTLKEFSGFPDEGHFSTMVPVALLSPLCIGETRVDCAEWEKWALEQEAIKMKELQERLKRYNERLFKEMGSGNVKSAEEEEGWTKVRERWEKSQNKLKNPDNDVVLYIYVPRLF